MALNIAEKIESKLGDENAVSLLKDIISKIDKDPEVVTLMMKLLVEVFKLEQSDGVEGFESMDVTNLKTNEEEVRVRLLLGDETDMYMWVEDNKIELSLPIV